MLKKSITCILFGTLLGGLKAQQTELHHLKSYENNLEGAAETVTYDPDSKKAFFTNAVNNSFGILNISDPSNPTLIKEVSLSSYGGGPNSIAIYDGIIAIAVENDNKQLNGEIVFFNTSGTYLGQITAGALPDMLTFTPDGSKLIVANEGEPNDDYTVDPIGSVSIIDLSNGLFSASITHLDFTSYNDKKAHLINKGVRIFGNNGTATVAEDLEPEFITVVEDGSKAYVNCQENNALVVIDLTNNTILDILPLGYKNHLKGTPTVVSHVLNQKVANWPSLGTPIYDGGQSPVMLGGFSGLFYSDAESSGNDQVFYAIPDRGPNGSSVGKADVTPAATQNIRPFKLPDYQARIVKFTLSKTDGDITMDTPIMLFRSDSVTPITGKGNIPGFDEVPVTYTDASTAYGNTDYTDGNGEEYHELPFDEFGGDFEGILIDKNGTFWMCDEYRPAIYHFYPNGALNKRYVPSGTSTLGTTSMPIGTYGDETLPAVYAKRRANRGFEAIAYDEDNHIIYAFIQSPLYNPSSVTKNNSDVIRILGIDADNGTPVSEYVYLLERNKVDGYATSRVDKIGDAVYAGEGKFLILERDSEDPSVREGKKYVYEIDINVATNILDTIFTGKELEEMTADEIVAMNIIPVHKNKMLNLPSIGYSSSDKPEGIALLPDNKIAVLNDNDFGISGAGITDNSVLGIISFADDYGFDASNKDNTENITAHPTLGMFMPDAISSYEVNGVNYIVTVNEGDARDYDGYSEEVRVKDLTLDPLRYPNAAALQTDENLGRLKTTEATGDYDHDGDIDQIYSYGARSFSIFDEYGNLVYDSGDEFGQTILSKEPTLFNEDDGELDGRSDDKGGEPEAVSIGSIGAYTYAFIGLERQSSIMVYDITDPIQPQFITYYTNRTVANGNVSGDVSPEIIKFIPAAESPNNENLLLVGYEVSGSIGIIQVGGNLVSISEELHKSDFKIFPNPQVGNDILNFNHKISGDIYDVAGKIVQSFNEVNYINTSALNQGVYIVKTLNKGTQRFLKLN